MLTAKLCSVVSCLQVEYVGINMSTNYATTTAVRLGNESTHLPTVVHSSWSSIIAMNTDASRRFLDVRADLMRSVQRRRPTSCHSTVPPLSSLGDSSELTRDLPRVPDDVGIFVLNGAAWKHVVTSSEEHKKAELNDKRRFNHLQTH